MAVSVPKVLALVREKRSWTQEQLGERMGLDKTQVSKFESGHRRLDLEDLEAFLNALGLSWQRFFRLLGLLEEVEAELRHYPPAEQANLLLTDLRETEQETTSARDLGAGWDDPEVEAAARTVTHALGDYQRLLEKAALRRLLGAEKTPRTATRRRRRVRRKRIAS